MQLIPWSSQLEWFFERRCIRGKWINSWFCGRSQVTLLTPKKFYATVKIRGGATG